MAFTPPQFSLAGGEVAPALYARADLDRYRTSLRVCRNMIVQKQGGVRNRPGTRLVAEVKDSSEIARLIPFVFSEDQSYVLVLNLGHARFAQNGGIVETSPGAPYEINVPYPEELLRGVRFDQSGDVMFLAHPQVLPWEIRRLAHTSWTTGAMALVPQTPAPGAPLFVSGTGDAAGSPEKEWDYVVTATNDLTGEESVASPVLTPSGKQPEAGKPLKIKWLPVAGCTTYSVYRGKNGKNGFIGDSKKFESGFYVFTDENFVPDYSNTPPTASNPFVGVGNYPSLVRFKDQRLCFAATDNYPERVWMSQVNNFRNFGASQPSRASDTVIFTPALRRVNRLRAIVDTSTMLLLSAGSEHAVAGASADGPITPSDVTVKTIGRSGSADVEPIVVDDAGLFIRAKSAGVSELRFQFEQNGYEPTDRSILADHLFEGRSVVAWAYSQSPDSVLWLVMSDGTLAAMTYQREHQVFAWHRHDTDGFYEDVVSVPEGGEDAVYFVVRRTVAGQEKRFLERMASRAVGDIRDAVFMDCAVTYDGRNRTATRIKFTTPGAYDPDEQQNVETDADAFVPGDVGAQVIFAGIPLTIMEYQTPRIVKIRVERLVPFEIQGLQTTDWGIARKRFATGLGHLEGKEIAILADGDAHPRRTVTGGVVTLQAPAQVVQFGLPYVSEIETLDMEFPENAVGGRQKIVDKAFVRVTETRGFWFGTDREAMSEWTQRQAADGYDANVPLATTVAELRCASGWGRSGRVVIQQRDPLPLTVQSILPSVTVGGA